MHYSWGEMEECEGFMSLLGDICTGVGLREACAPPRGMKSSGMSEIKKCVFSLGGMCTWGLLLAKRYIILWIMHYSFE